MSQFAMLQARSVDIGVGDGVRLHGVEMGSGPLVVLLHGFPETSAAWRHQVPALAERGYRALAVDMRGYGASSRPKGLAAYRIERLVDDVREVIASRSTDNAVVVGHDWGGIVAWCFAMHYPHLLDRLVILNAPHPQVFARKLWTPVQLRRSWYMFFFQLPWLPERGLRRLGLDDFGDAVNYYRAAFRWPPQRLIQRIEHKVLVIWGERDRYLGAALAEPYAADVPHARLVRLKHATHWLHWQAPGAVNAAILDFLDES